MTRKRYEGYDYIAPHNLYTYPNSFVLINKFGEKDDERASELEYRFVASQSLKLFMRPIEVHSVSDILKIHQFLFGGIYDWAGKYRKVTISKSGKAFMPIQSFGMAEQYLNRLISEYEDKVKSRDGVIASLADILDNLNYFHPFHEGNGRPQREVIRTLALMKGYECEINIGIDDDIYHLYMDGTVYAYKEKLTELFERILVEI